MMFHLCCLLLTAAFLLPGHYDPWVSFEQQVVAAVAVAGMGLCLVAGRQRQLPRVPRLALVAALAAVIPWLQWSVGQVTFFSDALLGSAYVLAFALAVIVGASSADEHREALIRGLLMALLVAGVASTGIGLLQLLGEDRLGVFQIALPPGGRPFANLGQPNHLCTLLALSAVAVLFLHQRGTFSAGSAVVVMAWLGLGMVMTQSRTGWCFVLLLFVWWATMRRRLTLRLTPGAIGLGTALFFAAVGLWAPLTEKLFLGSESMDARLSQGTRLEHWRTLWDAAGRAPWTGYGWAQVPAAQQAAVLDHKATGEWLLNSHNIVIDLVLWNGFPIGLLLSAAIVLWFYRQITSCRTAEQWILIAAVGAVWLHALLEFPLDYLYFLLPLGLMMGWLDASRVDSPLPTVPRPLVTAGVVGMLGLLTWISVEYVQVQESTRTLRFVLARVGTDQVPTAPVPEVVLLDQSREYHRFWLEPITESMDAASLSRMRAVVARHPVAGAMERYALAAGLNGRGQEALDTFGRLCKMHSFRSCDNARRSWTAAQIRHPVLTGLDFPDEAIRTALPSPRLSR